MESPAPVGTERPPGSPGGSPPSAMPVPVHVRAIEFRAFAVDPDALLVIGTLRDTRPWAADEGVVERVHDLELRVTVGVDDLVIREADAVMRTFPHVECPAIEPAFRQLVGLAVARGYTRSVQALFGGPAGCTHLEHLARSLGPVAVQAVTSRRAQRVASGEATDLLSGESSPWARNTCHVWADGGVAQAKLAAGWKPGVGPYPSPALVTFLAEPPRRDP